MRFIKKLIPKKLKKMCRDKMLRYVKQEIKNTEVNYRVFISDQKRLENKVAVITGGSGAIGSAICFQLAMEGAQVIIAGRDSNKAMEVTEYINKHNGKADIVKMDVTNYESIKEKFDEIYSKFGRIDILVNNAGGSAREKANNIENQDINVINSLIETNLKGTILCSKEVIQYMKKNKFGRIINIASTCGVNGLPKFSEYSACKAGVIGFTKSLAMELAKDNITVNCISPGVTDHIIWDKGIEASTTEKTYIGKMGKTDDIANAVEFFCREESSFIIGQNLIVDGGRSLGLKGN